MSKARIMWRVHAVLCLSFGLNGYDSNNAVSVAEKSSHIPLTTHTVAAVSIPDERVWDGVIEAEIKPRFQPKPQDAWLNCLWTSMITFRAGCTRAPDEYRTAVAY